MKKKHSAKQTALQDGIATTKNDSFTLNNKIPKRVQLPQGRKLEEKQFLVAWQEQNLYIDYLEAKVKVWYIG